jgi:hypothetical protein
LSETGINRSKELILELCEEAYPDSVSAKRIQSEARKKWPDDPRWTQREFNHGEIKFMHDINNAREKLISEELISNPYTRHYRLVKDSDSRGGLRAGEVWPEVLEQSYKCALAEDYCDSPDGTIRFQFSIHNQEPMILNEGGRLKPIGEKQVVRLIRNLNLCGGVAERPFKNMAELSAIVHCSSYLHFNDDGWVESTKRNDRSVNIFTSLEQVEERIFNLIEGILGSEPKGKRSVKTLVRESKGRSKGGVKRRNQPKRQHTIDNPEWIEQKEALIACEVTGIPFTDESGPFARSLDQRVPGAGYTKDNVDLVIRIYNLAKSVFGPEDVEKFCLEFYQNRLMR